jgi:hypothetical protein
MSESQRSAAAGADRPALAGQPPSPSLESGPEGPGGAGRAARTLGAATPLETATRGILEAARPSELEGASQDPARASGEEPDPAGAAAGPAHAAHPDPAPVPALWGADRLPLGRPQVLEFRRLYGTHTDADLAERFGLCLDEVQALARRFALAKDKAFNRRLPGAEPTAMPRWTRAELDLLVQLYPGTANLEIARRLKRTIKSVVSKAHHLGLKKTQSRLAEMGRENVALRYGEFAPGRSGELLPQPSRRPARARSARSRARRTRE